MTIQYPHGSQKVRGLPTVQSQCIIRELLIYEADLYDYRPVDPPLYENQRSYHPSAYEDGHDSYESSSLLPQQSSDYGSVPVPRNPKGLNTLSKPLGFFLLVLIIMGIVTFYFYPQSDWEAEQHAHQVMRAVWNSERQAMVKERGTWQKERDDHVLERETIAAEREKWRRERTEHDNRERQEREEIAAEREKLERDQKAIAAEREKWLRERTDHQNRERQEEEEKRALIIWQNFKASTGCLRYGTREYTATLANVPHYMDPLQECWKKSIDIHGRSIFPSRCDTEVRFENFRCRIFRFRVFSSFFFCFYFRESAGLLPATGMSTSTKLHALHGGGVMTTRYSLIYFNFRDTLIATTGLRRTGNPCSSSCYLSS